LDIVPQLMDLFSRQWFNHFGAISAEKGDGGGIFSEEGEGFFDGVCDGWSQVFGRGSGGWRR